jgi:antitoxin FitA
MAAVTIRNIPLATHRALKARAKLHARSTEAEIREILEAAVKPEQVEKGLGTALREIALQHGPFDLEIARDKSPARFVKFE